MMQKLTAALSKIKEGRIRRRRRDMVEELEYLTIAREIIGDREKLLVAQIQDIDRQIMRGQVRALSVRGC